MDLHQGLKLLQQKTLTTPQIFEAAERLKLFHRHYHRKFSGKTNILTNQDLIRALKIAPRKYYLFLAIAGWTKAARELAEALGLNPTDIYTVGKLKWSRPSQLISALKTRGKIKAKGRPSDISGYKRYQSRKELAGEMHSQSMSSLHEKTSNPAGHGQQPSPMDLEFAEEKIRNAIQSRVVIEGGEIKIPFISLDHLDGVVQKIQGDISKVPDPLERIREQEEVSFKELMGDGFCY